MGVGFIYQLENDKTCRNNCTAIYNKYWVTGNPHKLAIINQGCEIRLAGGWSWLLQLELVTPWRPRWYKATQTWPGPYTAQWKHKPGLLLCWTLLQASWGMKFNLERKQIGGTCPSQIRMQSLSALHCSLCRSGHLGASISRHARVMRGSSSGDIASSQTIHTAAECSHI